MSSNRQNLGWHGTVGEILPNSLLTIGTSVEVDLHKKGMFAPTKHAMNVDFVCWHGLFQRLTTDRIAAALIVLWRSTLISAYQKNFDLTIRSVNLSPYLNDQILGR